MTTNPPEGPADQEFIARLAALDESLAARRSQGTAPPGQTPRGAGPGPPDSRWRETVAVLELLHRVNPNLAGNDLADTTPTAVSAPPPGDDLPTLPTRLGLHDRPAPNFAIEPPKRVDRFLIERPLGRGGVGVVYLANDPRLGRDVAIKVLHAHDPETLARFQGEAKALASLQHTNIVQVFEVGIDPAGPFLVMEYVPGPTLRQRAGGHPLPDRDAARVVATIARAVAVAHRSGVIHRDLKPANILLTPDGTPKVVDFGLARRMGAGGLMTLTGVALGTPGYMAPEQATGDSRVVGPGMDVYGLGAILYELLTGHPPFEGVITFDILRQIVNDPPELVRRRNPAVSRELEAVCLRCLEKQPERRYSSADAVAVDIERFLAGLPTEARPGGPIWHIRRLCRRKWVVGLGVAALLLALGGALGLTLSTRPPQDGGLPPPTEPTPTPIPTLASPPPPPPAVTPVIVEMATLLHREKSVIRRVAVSNDGRLTAFVNFTGQTRTLDISGQRVIATLPGANGATTGTDARSVVFTANGQKLVFGTSRKGVAVWDVTNAQVIAQHEFAETVNCFATTPTADLIAVGHPTGAVHLWAPATGDCRVLPQDWKFSIADLGFHPTQQAILTIHQMNGRALMRGYGEAPIRVEIAGAGQILPGGAVILPDGKRVLTITPSYIGVLDIELQSCTRLISDPAGNNQLTCIAAGPAGRWALTGGLDNIVRAWDLKTGKELARVAVSAPTAIGVSGDGRTAVVGCKDGTLRELRLVGLD